MSKIPRPDITNEIEDTYPLSPLQQGMLFHTLLQPGSGVDIEQLLCELHEALDVASFQRAWRCVIAGHPVLRTNLRWENLAQPLQDVHAQVDLPWQEQDWRAVPPGEQEQRIADLLGADRRHGIDLARAPLFRLTLLRYGEAEFHLIWTFHHSVLEGRSFLMALREVFAYYEAFRGCRQITLPQPRPYRDYIAWLQQQDFSKNEAFWRETLKGFRAPTPLVVDHAPRPPHDGNPGHGSQELPLPAQLTSALRALAQENEFTLNTIVQGVWALLLSRYSGEEDVVFGVIRANRRSTIEGADAMIGLFLNTLPLRVRVNPEAALLPWLRGVREQWIAMRGHEQTPLAMVQGWSEVPGGTSLFQSGMMFETYHLDTLLRNQGGAWANRRFRLYLQTNYPLGLAAYDGAELRLRIDFDRSRIDAAAAGRMLGHVRTLLAAIASDPQRKLAQLPLLDSAERLQLLDEWNQTKRDYPQDKCVPQWFVAQAQRAPDAVAVSCDGLSYTYRELHVKAHRLAHHLRALGVGPDVLVGILLERSLDVPVAVLGVLMAGGAFVPLAPDLPPARLGFMLQDTQVRVLLTQTKLLPRLPATQAEVVCVDDGPYEADLKDGNLMEAPPRASSQDLAYVIYTSGSTGKPKGVLVTHGQITQHCLGMVDFYGLNPADRVLNFASLEFDVCIESLLPALLAGARVVLRGPDFWDPATLTLRIHEWGLTVIDLTPSYWQQWMESLDARSATDALGSLRLMICGGDVMPVAGVQRWRELHLERVRLLNMYGPTETTISACGFEVDANWSASLALERVPIGRPLANRCCYILDHRMEPVAIGVSGELYLGGAGVARGYLKREALTAERFLADPFSEKPGMRLYRTGDTARYLPDGNIEFLGRIDHQVKIRGYRIESGEIESTLQQHPAVREAIVAVREDAAGDKRLVAYVTANTSISPAGELRDYLKQKLPAYMVPSAFVWLDAFPLTPSGKLDRSALPPPGQLPPPPSAATAVAARNDLEIALVSVWERVLGVACVGITDNYFDLGGHSLMALRLVQEMETATGIKFDLADIFSAPSIEGLVARLSLNERNHPSVIVPLNKTTSGAPLFCLAGIELYRDLALALEGVCPVHAIYISEDRVFVQDAAEGGLAAISVEQLAESYYAAIRRSHIAGPYQLGGLSIGGIIALKVAARLEQEGETVSQIYLFDTILSRFISRTPLQQFAHWLRRAVLAPLVSRLHAPSAAPDPDQARRQANLEALRKVQAIDTPKHADVCLFRAASHVQSMRGVNVPYDYGWSAVLGRPVKVINIPGDHLSHIKDTNVVLVTQHIKVQLQR